jgi:uncharacterized protein with LGFP repeats
MRLLPRTVVATALALAALGLTGPAGQEAHAADTGTVHTIDILGSDPTHRAVPRRATQPFRMVGVTWDDPHTALEGTVEVRTRSASTGEWTDWRALDTDARIPETGPDHIRAGVRGGTQPLWTGLADGVQVRVSGQRLPEGMRVDLVDPDDGDDTATDTPSDTGTGTDTSSGTDTGTPSDTGGTGTGTASDTPQPTASRPTVTSRADWGADESLVRNPPTYTTGTQAMFVHHTAGTNDYTCAESASIVRGIFTYHVQSNGWNDIGYHFLVDKCGTVFEGRAGGIDKPVQGAHTYGFNTATSSISVLGDHNTKAVSAAARASIAKVAAWKLGLYGRDPSGTVALTAGADNGKYTAGQKVTLYRISGHRDGYPTDCPGQQLYGDLPAIRVLAANAGKLTVPTP